MRQQSFAADDFEKYREKTRKEIFLEEMDQIIPWKALSKVIKPYYPKPKGAGRRLIGIQRSLNSPIRVPKKRSMIHAPCANLSALIWVRNPCRARPLFLTSGI